MRQGGNEDGSVEIAVALFAGGLGREEAGMAGRRVQGDAIGAGGMLGAKGIGWLFRHYWSSSDSFKLSMKLSISSKISLRTTASSF